MNKKHQSPEFQIIVQDQANAKFFVASFMGGLQATFTPKTTGETRPSNTTDTQASSYGQDQGGFTF